jgi:MoaA/NifB/PqqE/SkfB family radical SAM enzyme
MSNLQTQSSSPAGASPDIPTHVTAGSVRIPVPEIRELTIEHARSLCGGDDEAFFSLIDQIALGTAAFHRAPLPDSDEAFQEIRQTVLYAEQIDDNSFLGEVITNTFEAETEFEPLPSEIVAAWNVKREGGNTSTLCHAPSTSLYFGRDGYVGACCYSRGRPVGRIPVQTIAEIWSSHKLLALRTQLAKSCLPMGCEICAEQILADNFEGFMAANFESLAPPQLPSAPAEPRRPWLRSLLKRRPAPVAKADERVEAPEYPRQMEFELSNKCNLECAMCTGFFSSSIRANREKKPPLPMIYDSAFVEQLREFIPHLTSAKFLGGEPFLIDLYYDIWELFIELNPTCEIYITTNAAVFTAKARRIVERLNCSIVISFDSITRPIYESIRVNANFERTLENLERICEINGKKSKATSIAICPMVSNWHELPELVSFANRRQMPVYFNTVTRPANLSIKFLPAAKQLEIVDFYRNSVTPANNPCEAANWRFLEDLANQIEAWSTMDARVTQEGLVVLA